MHSRVSNLKKSAVFKYKICLNDSGKAAAGFDPAVNECLKPTYYVWVKKYN